jgi:rubrerythrin
MRSCEYLSKKLVSREKSISNNYDIIGLVKRIMECEVRDRIRYKKIIDSLENETFKKHLRSIYNDEDRHYETMQKIYYQLTNCFIEAPIIENYKRQGLKNILKDCIDDELEAVMIYRQILTLLPDYRIKDIIYEIITDEQAHAAKLIEILSKFDRTGAMISRARVPISETSTEIKYKNPNIEVDLRIPVITGLNDKNIQNQINNSIESDIMEFKSQMEDAAKEYSDKAKAEGKQFIPYIASTNYTITYNKNNILSISIIYHQYISGRHTYIKASYNFDTVTGKSIGLGDLFKTGIKYNEFLNQEIRKQLEENKALYSPGAAQNFKGVMEGQPFYLDDGNIVVYFGFNEIAPTASEIPVIRIPLAKFKEQLKSQFVN